MTTSSYNISGVRNFRNDCIVCCQYSFPKLLVTFILLITLAVCTYLFVMNHKVNDTMRTFSYFHKLEPGFTRAVYYHGETWVIVDTEDTSIHNISYQHCEVMGINDQKEANIIRSHLNGTVPQEVTFSGIMILIERCDKIGNTGYDSQHVFQKESSGTSIKILPGTKWCGKGNEAQHYHDLGMKSKLDRCCRSHDLCPIKIRAHTTLNNFTNTGKYTWSHCECDRAFNECVKQVHGIRAKWVNKSYFDYLEMKCIEDVEGNINDTSSSTSTPKRRLASSHKIAYET